jgi:hypothetical protein
MALGTLILNAFSVRAAPGHFMRCRCSAIQNNVQTRTYDPQRHGATPSLLSRRPNRSRSAPPALGRQCRVADEKADSAISTQIDLLTPFLWSQFPDVIFSIASQFAVIPAQRAVSITIMS